MKGCVQEKVKKHIAIPRRGEVVILLGRVGSGKTTFVNHFLQVDSNQIFDEHLLVTLDFRLLEKGGSVRRFFYEQLRTALAKNQHFTDLSSKQLRLVYAPEIRELTIGPLAVLERQDKKRYEQKIADFLLQRFEDSEVHYPRVLRFLADKIGIRCFVLFDNVDQHDFEMQQEIFQFAHSFSEKCHAFSITTMWEETYLRSKKTGGTLSAYQPSHFTKLRLLEYLLFHRNHSTSYGLGFIWTDLIREEFGKFGTSETDIVESLRILASYLLVENDTYERAEIGKAYRITPAGRYYLRSLSNKFAYLDLVCQDTPIADMRVFGEVKDLVGSRELEDRFKRVAAFIHYLGREEDIEHAAILHSSNSIPLRGKLMTGLAKAFEEDQAFIQQKRRRRRTSDPEKTPYSAKE